MPCPAASPSATRTWSPPRAWRWCTTRSPDDAVDAEVRALRGRAAPGARRARHAASTQIRADAPQEFAAFLNLHRMILDDSALSQAPKELIRERRANAEWALVQQMEKLTDRFDEIDDPYLRERKADVQQAVERVLKALMGGADPRRAGAVGGARADRGGARPVARRHDPVQAPSLRRLHHRRRRRHLAHRHRGAQPRHPGDRRPAPRLPDHQRARAAHRRRRDGRGDRQPRSGGARRVPPAPVAARPRAREAQAPEVHARPPRSTARRSSSSPTSSCPRTCPRCSKPAPKAWASSAPSSCS